jgi:hypothetical protein
MSGSVVSSSQAVAAQGCKAASVMARAGFNAVWYYLTPTDTPPPPNRRLQTDRDRDEP